MKAEITISKRTTRSIDQSIYICIYTDVHTYLCTWHVSVFTYEIIKAQSKTLPYFLSFLLQGELICVSHLGGQGSGHTPDYLKSVFSVNNSVAIQDNWNGACFQMKHTDIFITIYCSVTTMGLRKQSCAEPSLLAACHQLDYEKVVRSEKSLVEESTSFLILFSVH